jgi:hypothetical protein
MFAVTRLRSSRGLRDESIERFAMVATAHEVARFTSVWESMSGGRAEDVGLTNAGRTNTPAVAV